jgi:hypothetical protein
VPGPVLAWLVGHRTPGWTHVAETASLLGGTVGTGGLAVVSTVVLWWRGRRARAAVWVVAALVDRSPSLLPPAVGCAVLLETRDTEIHPSEGVRAPPLR